MARSILSEHEPCSRHRVYRKVLRFSSVGRGTSARSSRGERGEGGSKCTCVLPFHRLQFGHEAFTNGLFSLFRSLEWFWYVIFFVITVVAVVVIIIIVRTIIEYQIYSLTFLIAYVSTSLRIWIHRSRSKSIVQNFTILYLNIYFIKNFDINYRSTRIDKETFILLERTIYSRLYLFQYRLNIRKGKVGLRRMYLIKN